MDLGRSELHSKLRSRYRSYPMYLLRPTHGSKDDRKIGGRGLTTRLGARATVLYDYFFSAL